MSGRANFLCTNCRGAMCPDCISIADEYVELLVIRTQALAEADRQIADLRSELELVNNRTLAWEKLAKLGVPALMLLWLEEKAAQTENPCT